MFFRLKMSIIISFIIRIKVTCLTNIFLGFFWLLKVAKGCHNLATEKNPEIWTQKYVKFYHNNFWIKISVIRAFSSQRVFSYPISKTIFRFSELDIYFCPFFKSSKYFWKNNLKIYRLQKSIIYINDF